MKTAKFFLSREATGLGARVHRPNRHDSCDDDGVRGRIARIIASRAKTLQAPSYIYVCVMSL